MAVKAAPGSRLQVLARSSDVVIVIGVIVIITMMILPLPPFLLDILLTLNISLSLLVLLLTMNVQNALQLSVFPSLLLIATLFRLALNISSTRLILLNGFAGQIIQSFGNFVVGGNYVVGFVVFLILVVIQFIVITKGAERVAEVAARFTLDAMPGKQMSIDADLNAGLIDESAARKRRQDIEQEADFYGAMDGASKFVKGDAIAGIVITVINIIGGFAVGIGQEHLEFAQALQKYTLLTVGDGLVSQIPALLISTSAGIIITRVASEGNMGQDLTRQLFTHPKVLAISSGVLLVFALVPGLPTVPFLFLAAIMGGLAYSIARWQERVRQSEAEQAAAREIEEGKKAENVMSLLTVDRVELEIGYSLIPLVDTEQGGDLLERITMIRRQQALELGIVLPTVRIRDNMQLPPNTYVIKIKGVEVGRGELMLDRYLAMSTGAEEDLPGLETTEPAFGLPAKWIEQSQRDAAELAGYTVVDPPSVLATHLTEVLKKHAHELLGRQEVKDLLDNLREEYGALVEETTPELLSLGEIQKVLQNLLKERVSIRNLPTILEVLADKATVTKDVDTLTEFVREGLARQISRQLSAEHGFIPVITLDPALEEYIASSVQQVEGGAIINIPPEAVEKIYARLGEAIEKAASSGYTSVVLCSPQVRLPLRRITERAYPQLDIISYNEVAPDTEVQSVGMVTWDNAH